MRLNACRAAVVVALWPSLVFAQEKTGVVTTLEGHVTAVRVATPQPIQLKFKDDVYRNDRITTGDRSLARMLLGGKAVVTVRERSVITITEVPGKSTIDLVAGKIGLAVAKDRMRPGESIEVKTPNAVAAVRGTVIVAEVQSTTAQAGAGAPGVVTQFYVLRGAIDAFQFVPGTNTPIGGALRVTTLHSFTAAGSAPPHVDPITPDQVAQITAGLTPGGLKQEQGTTDQVVSDQFSMAGWPGDTAIDRGRVSRPFQPFAGMPPGSPVTLDETPTTPACCQAPPANTPPPGNTGNTPPPPGNTGNTPPPPGNTGNTPPPISLPPDTGKLRGLDRADQVGGEHGRPGRQNAREKQGR